MPPKPHKNSLSIRLTEPVVFLRGSDSIRSRTRAETTPSLLRGLLTLTLVKPTKISSIEINLEGRSKTAWPEGIGARRIEVVEEHKILSASTVFFEAGKLSSAPRRPISVGPGLILDHDDDEPSDDTSDSVEEHPRGLDDHSVSRPPTRAQRLPEEMRQRRMSADQSILFHDVVSHRQQTQSPDLPTPAYTPVLSANASALWLASGPETPSSSRFINLDRDGEQSPGHQLEEFRTALVEGLEAERLRSSPNAYRRGNGHSDPQSSSSSILSYRDLALSRRESIEEEPENQHTDPDTQESTSPPHLQPSASEPTRPASRSQSRGRTLYSHLSTATRERSETDSLPRSSDSRRSGTPTSSRVTPLQPLQPVDSSVPGSSLSPQSHSQSHSHSPSTSRRPTLQTADSTGSGSSTTNDRPRSRGRRLSSRFSLSAVSNVLFEAVKERVRSNSPRTRNRTREREMARDASREVSMERVPEEGGEVGAHRERSGNVERERDRDRGAERGRAKEKKKNLNEQVDSMKHAMEKMVLGKLGGATASGEDGTSVGDGWKEFRKGTYTYPISFIVPPSSPPTLHCDYGSVVYTLKATVHRPGTFTTKMTASREVTLVAAPGEDDLEETDSLVVQRQWDNQMHYVICVSGRAFPIGSVIPIQITLFPTAKVKVYRVAMVLEERVDYYTQFKRIARSDVTRRFELLSIRNAEKDAPPLLPLQQDFATSPLRGLLEAADDDEAASIAIGPGPWTINCDLQLPNSCGRLHFTNRHKRSNIGIHHLLKIIMRVERGDDEFVDKKTGKRRLFDIVVQTPVHILSCRCNSEWTSLPRYSSFANDHHAKTQSCGCKIKRRGSTMSVDDVDLEHAEGESYTGATTPSTSNLHTSRTNNMLRSSNSPGLPVDLPQGPANGNSGGQMYVNDSYHGLGLGLRRTASLAISVSDMESLYNRNVQFARLVSGQESEIGEPPPTYTP